MNRLTDLERDFLETIVRHGGLARRHQLGLAPRDIDRARQKCRRDELAIFKSPHWIITDKGRAALSAAKE